MKLRACIAGALVAICAPAADAVVNPVALVSEVRGQAQIFRGKESERAAILADVFVDSRLELAGDARLVLLIISSGEEATLLGPASAQMRSDGLSAIPASALTRRKSSVGNTPVRRKDVAQAAMVMRSKEQTIRPPLLTLAATRTLEERLVFRWTQVDESGPWRFALYDDAGNTLYEARTTAAEIALPASVALREGPGYTWEVTTRRANGLEYSNFGDFSLAPAELRRVAIALRPQDDAPFEAWVAYGVWLDTQGLADAAREIWVRLSRERPDEAMLRKMVEP